MLQGGNVIVNAIGRLGPMPDVKTMQMVGADGHDRMSWLLPACAGGRNGRCAFGSTTLGPKGGLDVLTSLADLAASGASQLVLLHNPCAAHSNGLLPSLSQHLANMSLDSFGAQRHLLPRPCVPFQPALRGPRSSCANFSRPDVPYLAKTRAAAAQMARLHGASRSNLAMIIETPPAHNPALPGCLSSALRGLPWRQAAAIDAHEYEGFVLSVMEYARQLGQMARGLEVLRRLNVDSPQSLMRQTALLSRVHALARLGERRCAAPQRTGRSWCVGRDEAFPHRVDCMLAALPKLQPPHYKTANGWTSSFRPGPCEPRAASLTAAAAWRQRSEQVAADEYALPLLSRSAARERRWDLHPALQQNIPNHFDCKHSTFLPGAFDAEALAFLDALEVRFGRGPSSV